MEKEAYAIVFATKTFYPYLYGRRFTVFTDHKPLEWLMNIKEPTGRLMRWSLMLQEYDMAIGYRPGKTNQNADSLSRAPVNQVAAPPSLGTCTLKEEQEKDEFCQKVKRTIEKKGKKSRYIVREDGLIGTSDGRVLVPLSLRLNVLRRLHDHKLAAHLGQAKVLARLRNRFIWPGMQEQAKEFIKNCISCQKRKAHKRNLAPLRPLPMVTYVWERVAMDIVGPLECTRSGNRYILAISEYATKYIETIGIKDQTALTVAEAFTNRIILRYGCPSQILTDQGPCFQSDLMKELCRILDIKQLRSSPYHAPCNGAVENINKTLGDMLAPYVFEDPTLWDEYLPFVTFAYNTSVHASLKETPFYLLFGHDAMQPDLIEGQERYRDAIHPTDIFLNRWFKAKKAARIALGKAQLTQKEYYDRNVQEEDISEGNLVLLRDHRAGTGKFEPRWLGPFKVIKVLSNENYLINQKKTNTVVHKNRLKKWLDKDPLQNPALQDPVQPLTTN